MAAYENHNNHDAGYMFGQGELNFQSPLLDVHVTPGAYLVKTPSGNGLTDSLRDMSVQRPFTGYWHIDGIDDNLRFDMDMYEGYIQFHRKYFQISMGKKKLRWGPGYKGTLGWSGTTKTPFYWYHLELKIPSRFQFSAFLAGLDDEALYFSSDERSNKTEGLTPRYAAGQRLDVRINKHIQFGLYEFVDFYGTNELNRYGNPFHLYYLGNQDSKTNKANIMGGGDINVLARNMRWYFDFLNDDITVFDDNGSPNKFAMQLGWEKYLKKSIVSVIGFEYTHVSWYTYGHYAPGLGRHEFWGEPLGWPWGNDQDLIHARVEIKPIETLRIMVELNYHVKGDGLMTDYHWDEQDSGTMADMDNIGGFNDYRKDRKFLSGLIHGEWSILPFLDLDILYRPVFGADKGQDIHAYLVCAVPGNIRRSLAMRQKKVHE